MIGNTRERFICSVIYFVLLGVLWVPETLRSYESMIIRRLNDIRYVV